MIYLIKFMKKLLLLVILFSSFKLFANEIPQPFGITLGLDLNFENYEMKVREKGVGAFNKPWKIVDYFDGDEHIAAGQIREHSSGYPVMIMRFNKNEVPTPNPMFEHYGIFLSSTTYQLVMVEAVKQYNFPKTFDEGLKQYNPTMKKCHTDIDILEKKLMKKYQLKKVRDDVRKHKKKDDFIEQVASVNKTLANKDITIRLNCNDDPFIFASIVGKISYELPNAVEILASDVTGLNDDGL